MSRRRKLSPYQRIVKAAKAGRGIRLSADECFDLGEMDDAIYSRAQVEDDEYEAQRKAAKEKRNGE